MKKTTNLLLTTATLVFFAGSTAAQTAYLDFGSTSATGTVNSVTYNDITIDGGVSKVVAEVPLELNGAASTLDPILLFDTTNAATTWGFEIDMISTAGSIGDNSTEFTGPYPPALAGIEESALRSHFYLNRGGDVAFRLTGLDDNASYNIVIYGASRQVGNITNSTMTFTPVIGSGTDYTEKTLQTFENTTDVLAWSQIAPSSGTIEFNIGGTGVTMREGWLNFMSVEVAGGPALPGDTDGDGDVDDSDLGNSFANYTGPVGDVGKTSAEGDTDGDGDVDDSDLGTSFSNYTGPLSPGAVPEPTSLALLGLGGLALARRRRA